MDKEFKVAPFAESRQEFQSDNVQMLNEAFNFKYAHEGDLKQVFILQYRYRSSMVFKVQRDLEVISKDILRNEFLKIFVLPFGLMNEEEYEEYSEGFKLALEEDNVGGDDLENGYDFSFIRDL